jgi:plastocyanin
MRRLLTIGVTFAALAAAPVAEAANRNVNIFRTGFQPVSVTITENDTVTWINRDTRNHQVVSDRGNFVSPILAPGRRFQFQFRDAGTFRYRDALNPSERGTIVVRGLPPAVSLGATVPILRFGDETKLTGVINTGDAGETVTIWAQAHGEPGYAQVAAVQTGTNGGFEWATKPAILTNYQVRFRTATSQPVTVQVQVRLTLLPGRRGWFLARAHGARSFAGRSIFLQRRSEFGQWVSIRKLQLGRNSGKLFRIPRRPARYRVFMTVNQAGAGYLAGWSGTQTVRSRR